MNNLDEKVRELEAMARRMRRTALKLAMSVGAAGAHLGGGLSMIEIMAALYGKVLRFDPRNPRWEDRDRFILSKGHGVLAFYPALAEAGILGAADLEKFETPGSCLHGHPVMNLDIGIEASSGSLGMGLSLGIGIAIAGRKKKKDYCTYVLLGDGECNEGTIWEAAMAAANFRLGRLVVVIDDNQLQYDGGSREIMNLGDFSGKWAAFGWKTADCDGHDVRALLEAFSRHDPGSDKPYVIIAKTVKGKGVAFMENKKEWHFGRMSQAQFESAMKALEDGTPEPLAGPRPGEG